MPATKELKEASEAVYITLPNGGKALRCQATNRSGKRCARPASKDYKVCSMHGVGTKKRVLNCKRKRPGRPVEHGLYSKEGRKTLLELRDIYLDNLEELDNTNKEFANLKAIFQYNLNQEQLYLDYEAELESLILNLNANGLDEDTNTALQNAERLLDKVLAWRSRMTASAYRVICAANVRANINNRLAESIATGVCMELTDKARRIVWDFLEPAEIDMFEARLQAELFGPNAINLKEDSTQK